MANQITFQIKIETLGEENVKNVTMDAEELGRVVKEVTDEQEKLNTKLLDINQAQQAIQNVVSGISQIASEIRDYTSAYSQQETAETKVAQVMRNTMNASEAEIESIKKLCAAQQELGVIGDEVQLSGAQELATYLEKKSSLEKLIPVMNDMLAQQYGLEASQESAAQIATMLGKVMDGQVNALSRYGYSFTEAQEQVLKFGTEEERAATLAEVVSQSVGGMNQALRQTPSGELKAAENTLGDLKEQVGACMVYLEPFVSKLDAAGRTVQSLTSLANGAMGVSRALHLVNVTQKAWHATTVTTTALVRTLTAAMRGGAVGATTLKVAIRGLLISTGIGAAIAALTFAIDAFISSSDKAAASSDDFTKAQGDETLQLQQTRAALEINIAKLKDFHGSKEQEKKIVEEMNNTYGETMGYFSSVADWYNALIKNSDAYCRQMVIEARTRMLANQIAEKEQENHNLLKDEKGQARQFSKQRITMFGEEIEGSSEWEVASRTYRKNIDIIKDLRKQMQGAAKDAAEIKMPVIGASSATTPGTRPAGAKGGKKSGGTEAVYTEDARTLEELSGNVKYYTEQISKADLGDAAHIATLEKKKAETEALIDVVRKLGTSAAGGLTPDLRSPDIKAKVELDTGGAEERMKKLGETIEGLNLRRFKEMKSELGTATDSIGQLGSSLSGLGNALELPELNFAGVLAQAIATMVQGYAQATAQSSALGPWAWLAFGALGLAQLTSMITSVKQLSKFADGGVAYGPTLGLFGEYANAATNPEVVAPLDKLRGLIGGGGDGPVEIKLRMRGRDLVGVSEKRHRLVRRT